MGKQKGGTASRGNAAPSLVANLRKQTARLAVWTADVVLLCALTMLGRSEASFPPITMIQAAAGTVSAGAEGFVRHNDAHIYLVTTSETFREAQASTGRCGNVNAIRKIASVLIHEEAHLRQGADERTAYEAQLTMLAAMGAGPGSPAYQATFRAMQRTVQQQRRAAGQMASAMP
jgi:hypothetical protein